MTLIQGQLKSSLVNQTTNEVNGLFLEARLLVLFFQSLPADWSNRPIQSVEEKAHSVRDWGDRSRAEKSVNGSCNLNKPVLKQIHPMGLEIGRSSFFSLIFSYFSSN